VVATSGSVATAARIKLRLGYDGSAFSGWALQPDQRTVQGEVERALSTLFRVERVRLTVAGRTDTGVHASGQIAHCDVPAEAWQDQEIKGVRRLAGLLPADVRVLAMTPAPSGFDARFSALWRRYRYKISDAQSGVDPLHRHDTVAWRRKLDDVAMQQAAQQLLGLHDFAAFCRRRDGATSIRTLQQFDVFRSDDRIDLLVQADAFCHSMVRSLVGALAAVGEGSRGSDWPADLLASTERSDKVAVAPAHGLTLVEVGYPEDAELADRAERTRALRKTC
jgi:tRNA pseudouridine38-40 synthase